MKDGQTIGQWLNWDFEANGDFEIRNKDNKIIYVENSDRFWAKWELDSENRTIYYEDSDGYWEKQEYDSQGNEIYYESSNGFWEKKEYDSQGNKIYSGGAIIDNRPKPCSDKEIIIEGVKYKLTKV